MTTVSPIERNDMIQLINREVVDGAILPGGKVLKAGSDISVEEARRLHNEHKAMRVTNRVDIVGGYLDVKA